MKTLKIILYQHHCQIHPFDIGFKYSKFTHTMNKNSAKKHYIRPCPYSIWYQRTEMAWITAKSYSKTFYFTIASKSYLAKFHAKDSASFRNIIFYFYFFPCIYRQVDPKTVKQGHQRERQ